MTDQELLELAAKAAGMELLWTNDPDLSPLTNDHKYNPWNPLVYDGDALRLAVKLAMSVEISEYEDSTYAYAGQQPRVYAYEMWGEDKCAATRRAIVRAAAAIDEAMP